MLNHFTYFKLIFTLICLAVISFSIGSDVSRPPMGWTSSYPNCAINQTIAQQIADKLVSLGLVGKGYQYLKLNDCWQGKRNQTTKQISEDVSKFPSGISGLIGYLRNKGLKLGLGSDISNTTCSGRQGSYNYQNKDALTYANWQVDYVEYTNCNNLTNPKLRYYLMSKSLNQTGKSIFYSINNQGNDRAPQWASGMANSWRTAGDSEESWASVVSSLEKQVGLENYSRVGGFNDPGELLVGSQKLTHNEQYAQFALWCVLKASLFIKTDLNNISSSALQILNNQELIAINQDASSIQAKRVKSEIGSQFKREVWGGPLSGNRYVVVFLNRGQTQTIIQVSLKNDLGVEFGSFTQRDPIRHINVGISNKDLLSQRVASHSVQVRVLSLMKQPHLMFQ